MTKRSLGITIALWLVLLGLLGAGCSTKAASSSAGGRAGQEADAGPPQTGGLLTVGVTGETSDFNPYAGQWSAASYTVANALIDPLAAIDPDGTVRPYLAASIQSDPSFLTWTIGLRPGVTFHDGTPVDAAAVKRDLDTAKSALLTSQVLQPLESVEAPDPTQVVVHMSQPWATFPSILATQVGYIVAPKMLDDPQGANAKIVGSGPFVFEARQRDSFIKAHRNPDYWQKDRDGHALPYLDAIEFTVIPDPSTRKGAIDAGDINATQAVTADELAKAQGDAAQGKYSVLGTNRRETDEAVLGLNTSRPPFDDLTARQALAYALDQEELSTIAYQSQLPAAWGMFEEGSPWYISKQDAGYPEPDVDRAKALATQYEDAHGTPIEFSILSTPDIAALAADQVIQSQLAKAGIKVDISSVDLTTLINKVIVQGDYEAAQFTMWSSPNPDQGYLFVATPPNADGLSVNFPRFDDPELTAAFDDYRATADPAQQKDAIARVQKELAKNLQMIFLYHYRGLFEYDSSVHGFNANTFPDDSTPAYAPFVTTPFFTHVWFAKS